MSRNSLCGQVSNECGRGNANEPPGQREQSGRVKEQFRGVKGKEERAGQIMKPWQVRAE